MTSAAVGVEPVVILGAGRAGRALAAACRAASLAHALVDRETIVAQQGPPVFVTRAQALRDAHVVLVAVRDAQLDVALDELLTLHGLGEGRIVLQVSGSAEPAARARMEAAGVEYGTCHPLLPLVDPAVASARLQGSVIGIEGAAPAREAAAALARAFGASTIDIPRAHRAAYHAAAVIASNFPVTLAALAEELLARIGVDAPAAHRAIRALMAASVENLAAAPRALDVLTGPIARGDVATVRAHATALHGQAPMDVSYDVLSRATLELLARRDGVSDAVRAAMDRALEADGAR
jgi:predicted short-subunit dehydrogenase-like oxidoreductase (DUF2520 family)